MLAVALSPAEVVSRLPDEVDLAVVNCERMTVIAGPLHVVAMLEAELSAEEIACRIMETTHAFHSRMLAPAQEALTDLVSRFSLSAPQIPCLSNVTGAWLTPTDATDPRYWGRHMCSPVRFHDGLEIS